mgnify:CR=1 FL=1
MQSSPAEEMTQSSPGGERIRVLQIITRLAARGAPRHVLDLALRIDSERFDVSILTGTPEPDEGDLLDEARRRGLCVDVIAQMCRPVRPIQDLVALYKIFRFIRRGRYSVVHTHISKAGILGRIAAWLARTPVVLHTYHGPVEELSNPVLLAVERWVARRTDILIAVSPGVVEHQLALRLGRAEQYEVIPNGIDHEWYQSSTGQVDALRASLGGQPVIGTIGSLTAEKGTEGLINAAATLREGFPELRVCIVGDGHRSQGTTAERVFPDVRDAVRDGHRGQGNAVRKRHPPDVRDAVGDGHRGQRLTPLKRPIPDVRDAVGDDHRGQRLTQRERSDPNARDAVRDGIDPCLAS